MKVTPVGLKYAPFYHGPRRQPNLSPKPASPVFHFKELLVKGLELEIRGPAAILPCHFPSEHSEIRS